MPKQCFTWNPFHCPCKDVMKFECVAGGCKWQNDPSLVPAECRVYATSEASESPTKVPVPPFPADPFEVVFVEGWNACVDSYFNGTPAPEPVIVTLSKGAPSVTEAEEMGAKGGPVDELERLAFEAWLKGHQWAFTCEWDGRTYIASTERYSAVVDPAASTMRMLWAAWRDRAALCKM